MEDLYRADFLDALLQRYGKRQERILPVLLDKIASETPFQQGKMLLNLGELLRLRAAYTAAFACWQQAYTIFQTLDNPEEQANALHNMALAHRNLGNPAKALELLFQTLDLDKQTGRNTETSSTYLGIAHAYQQLGDPEAARQWVEKALALDTANNDQFKIAGDWNMLGLVISDLGDFHQSNQYHQKALALFEAANDGPRIADARLNIGMNLHKLGDPTACETELLEALRLYRLHRRNHGVVRCLNNLGLSFKNRGQYQKASEYLVQALALYREMGNQYGYAVCLGNLGALSAQLGQFAASEAYYSEKQAVCRAIGDRHGEVNALMGLATAAEADPVRSNALYTEAFQQAKTLADRDLKATLLLNFGISFFRLGDLEQAEKWLKKALALNRTLQDAGIFSSAYNALGTVKAAGGHDRAAAYYCHKAIRVAAGMGEVAVEQEAYINLFFLYYRKNRLARCLAYADKALACAEQIRRAVVLESQLLTLRASREMFHRQLVEAALQAGQPARSFAYLEQARSQALHRMMAAYEWSSLDNEDQPAEIRRLLALEKKLAARLRAAQTTHLGHTMPQPGHDLSAIQQQLSDVHRRLEKHWPEYVALRRGKSLGYAAVREWLPAMPG
ncbi:MAG: tetratricopeptide repeat protein [Lewinellaceae bacterium]|nr:tetratricopeptide repeat protein [Lewinellaceae bacterium]